MRGKFLLTVLLALPLLIAAVGYGRLLTRCHHIDAASVTAEDSEKSGCCVLDRVECCLQEVKADAPKQNPVHGNEPDKPIVFRVEGLRCPAVKGIGCGQMLRPVLASLDRIDGVQGSSTNYTGTMVRVAVSDAADRAKVTEKVRAVLAQHKPVLLAGDDVKLALEREQWRETRRVGELSAIEFRTMALYRIKKFAQAEQLSKQTTDALTKIAGDLWEQLAQEAKKDKATEPEDWASRCKKSIPAFLAQAQKVLTGDQLERFKQSLTCPCRGDDRPEAPPAVGEKSR